MARANRLRVSREAKAAGLTIFVAMAPTYPECDKLDLETTLQAIAELDPITIFHEPINIRAENVERIKKQGNACGVSLNTDVFASATSWQDYARGQLKAVHQLAKRHRLTEPVDIKKDLYGFVYAPKRNSG